MGFFNEIAYLGTEFYGEGNSTMSANSHPLFIMF